MEKVIQAQGRESDYRVLIITVKKQKINTKSSTEAEIVAVSDMLSHAIYTRYLLQTKVYQDNITAMRLMDLDGNNSCNRTKHIDIRYYWIKDKIKMKEVEVVYQPTQTMVADILTKLY